MMDPQKIDNDLVGALEEEELKMAIEMQKKWDLQKKEDSNTGSCPWKKNAPTCAARLSDIMSEEIVNKIYTEKNNSLPVNKENSTTITLPIEEVEEMDPDLKLAMELQKQFDAELSIDDTDREEALRLQKIFDEEIAQIYDKDHSLDISEAKKLQHEWDIEVLNEESPKPITFGMTRYKFSHDDEVDDYDALLQEYEDEEDIKEKSWIKKYEKKDNFLGDNDINKNDCVATTKHDTELAKIRNADKTMNFAIGMNIGDCSDEKISNKVFNKLRQYSKDEIKRNFKIKDKAEKSTYEQGMDEDARLIIFKLIQRNELDTVEGIIASGKESIVLHAKKEEWNFAIKVYKKTLSEFKNRNEYVKDDFRFKNPRHVLKVWTLREFLNLRRLMKAEINAPEPLYVKKNVLVMRMIGEDKPALKLKDVLFQDEESKELAFKMVEKIICDMYKNCKLVHGDLSEFNLLYHKGVIYVIDVSQAMDLSHPNSLVFLLRDIENILNFFNSIGTQNLPSSGVLFEKVTNIPIDPTKSVEVQVEQFEADNRNIHLRDDKAKPCNVEIRAMAEEECNDC
ncbi:Serine/threonine-protein kinase RIO3 [Strongyloides ratti]|uniref:Serine/threonine-protein kinase RIO3 n=1 Tax=Strongyloides ratti TaxID=34506 RepID=A0A090MX57_STRRB|nr:Serine/threonine-protein kinase RIO3 [Strongyloides ratti]CEF64854.1 Serine/threonine-protein kinase RIO3 [Strongyloides ratti]